VRKEQREHEKESVKTAPPNIEILDEIEISGRECLLQCEDFKSEQFNQMTSVSHLLGHAICILLSML